MQSILLSFKWAFFFGICDTFFTQQNIRIKQKLWRKHFFVAELSRETVESGLVWSTKKLALSFDKHQQTSTKNYWSMTLENGMFPRSRTDSLNGPMNFAKWRLTRFASTLTDLLLRYYFRFSHHIFFVRFTTNIGPRTGLRLGKYFGKFSRA